MKGASMTMQTRCKWWRLYFFSLLFKADTYFRVL